MGTVRTVTVRAVDPADAATLGEILAEAYLVDGLVPEGDGYLPVLRDVTGRVPQVEAVLAAYAGEEVLGGLTLVAPGTPHAEVAHEGELELRMLGVAPVHRGRRVGEALLRGAEEVGRARGYAALVLSTMASMPTAHRLYRRYGFHRVPERDWLADWDPQALADGTAETLSVYRLPLD